MQHANWGRAGGLAPARRTGAEVPPPPSSCQERLANRSGAARRSQTGGGGLRSGDRVSGDRAIEVGAAVHEDAIFGIELPDRVASPVVVNKDFLGLVAVPQERDRFLGKLFRLGSILAAGKTDPLHQCKHSHQRENSPVKKWPEPRGGRIPLGGRLGTRKRLGERRRSPVSPAKRKLECGGRRPERRKR